MQRRQLAVYSITSGEREQLVGGRVSRAPLRSSVDEEFELFGCSTGKSAGFAPRSILSTKSAARRYRSGKFGP